MPINVSATHRFSTANRANSGLSALIPLKALPKAYINNQLGIRSAAALFF